jgi:photosystem II stability/assembly factor-like uncharacterized protein
MPTIYGPMRDRLFVVTGEPGDWQAREHLDGHDLECVAVHPDAPERVFVGTFDAGLWRSEDGRETWRRVGEDTLEESVMSATADPHDPESVWVGTEPSRVYCSRDGGDTWTEKPGLTDLPSAENWYFPPRPDTHHVRWIEVDPADPEHLYVGIEAGALVQTHDAGDTWEDRVPDSRRDNHSLTTYPDAPGRAWAAAGDGYAETRDGGETWTHPQDGLAHRYCWSVAVDATDPGLVLLSSASGARTAHTYGTADSYVYRRRDGEPWERLDDRGLPTGEGVVRAVLAAGTAGGEFYASNNHGLFRTTDAGDDWTRLDVVWPDAFETGTVRGLAVVSN